jgi:hypothetical protein
MLLLPLLSLLQPLWGGYQAGASALFWRALFNHSKNKIFIRIPATSE